jgi:NAD(P)-dependent dehydrogenase (short-subunit alcohol dehydrogenase family)
MIGSNDYFENSSASLVRAGAPAQRRESAERRKPLRQELLRQLRSGSTPAPGSSSSSGAAAAVYSATKAAIHSYVLSQRFMLKDTPVRVLEIIPPWVRTELMNSQDTKQAMPLEQFIEETIAVLGTDADEILVDAARPLRINAGPNEHGLVNGFNSQMMAIFGGG